MSGKETLLGSANSNQANIQNANLVRLLLTARPVWQALVVGRRQPDLAYDLYVYWSWEQVCQQMICMTPSTMIVDIIGVGVRWCTTLIVVRSHVVGISGRCMTGRYGLMDMKSVYAVFCRGYSTINVRLAHRHNSNCTCGNLDRYDR